MVLKNISATIAVEHEVIIIDNSFNNHSISQAYNQAARKSKYDLLCFLHEDVALQTQGWGTVLQNILKDKTIGIVGIAGGILKTKAVGPTWWSPLPLSARLNVIQHYSSGGKDHLLENPQKEKLSEVVTLDGVFMACRKEVWERFPFDENTLKAFHFYDMDFSLSVGSQYKNVVTYDILLEHFSEGKNDKVWAEQADIVHRKWSKKLPKATVSVSSKEIYQTEIQIMDFYLSKLFETGCSKALIFKYVVRRFISSPRDLKVNFYFLKKLF